MVLKRAVEVDATVAREGMEFGVVSREVAVGGQLLTLRGLGGEYPDIFLPMHGAHMAHNASVALAAVEAFFGVGAGARPHARHRHRPAGVRLGDHARPPGAGASSAARRAGRRAQPGRRAGSRRGDDRGVQLQPARSGWSGRAATRTYGGCWRRSSRSSRRSWSPGTPRTAPWTWTRWRRSPSRCSARNGCRSSRGSTTPLEAAVTLAEEEDEYAGGGRAGHRLRHHGRRGPAAAGKGPLVRTLCASTLLGEFFVIGFAGLVAMRTTDLSTGTVWTVSGVAMALCLLLCGALTRPGGRARSAGLLQAGLIASVVSWCRRCSSWALSSRGCGGLRCTSGVRWTRRRHAPPARMAEPDAA